LTLRHTFQGKLNSNAYIMQYANFKGFL